MKLMCKALTLKTDYTKVPEWQKYLWTTFMAKKKLTPFVESFPDTVDYDTWGTPQEFDNAVDVPMWKAADPEDKYAITMKDVLCFDDACGKLFQKRAKRMANNFIIGTFKTEKEVNTHPLLTGFFPHNYYVFVWDRKGNLINGVY